MVIRDFRSMVATFACAALFNLFSFAVFAADEPSDGVGTRGVDARMTAEPRLQASKEALKLPPLASATRKFEVVGPESDSLGFAVTQPGPIRIDVQTQGAPIVVTLQSPGHAPIVQQGSGALTLGYDVTAGDVEKSVLWSVQVRLIEPAPPQQGGRANGTITAQSPPADDARVQAAIASAKQAAPPAPDAKSASDAAQQFEQVYRARQAQLDQDLRQQRATLYAQIQGPLDQLRSRVPADVANRSRNLQQQQASVVSTRAAPMQRPAGRRMSQAATQPPAFPQPFQVQGPETSSFAFVVTQPGPIAIDVEAQGAPVSVTLRQASSTPIVRQGTGMLKIGYDVSAADIQRSALWVVTIALIEPGRPPALGQASGNINLQHPAGDLNVAQAQLAAMTQRTEAERGRVVADLDARSSAAFAQFRASLEQAQISRQSAERATNQQLLVKMNVAPPTAIRTRGLAPVVDRLSKSTGQPKDQVIVFGHGFGAGGEAVFQLAPNVRGTGIVEAWSDTVVVVDVPDASGLLAFDGTLSISAGGASSNAVPFRFEPAIEVREIRGTRGDVSIAQPGAVTTGPTVVADKVEHLNTTFMSLGGSKGNDIFFPTKRLSNGWTVRDIRPSAEGSWLPWYPAVMVVDSRVGSDIPYFNVRWWYDALTNLHYHFSMWVSGPRGVPDGILVTGVPQPVVPPGTPAPATTAPANQPPQVTATMLDPAVIVALGPQPTTNQPPAQTPPPMTAATLDPVLLIPTYTTTGTGQPGGTGTTGSTQQSPPSQPPQTTPLITSLSVTQGRPFDPVLISGSNFGGNVGKVYFVVAPGQPLVAAPEGLVWTDNQIFTTVPDKSGVFAFNGQVYVERAADKKTSNLAAFRFEPTIELRRYGIPTNLADKVRPRQPAYTYNGNDCGPGAGYCLMYYPPSIFEGAKATDQYFANTRLQNGWVLDDVAFRSVSCAGGCNYLDSKAVGTDRPSFGVRWWVNAGFPGATNSTYAVPWITLRGPKGVADGLSCAPSSCTPLP